MSKLILDLDYTLLDTTAFSKALADSLGISREQWLSSYDQFVKDNGFFSAHDFLRGVSDSERKQFYAVLENLRRYCYKDAWPFLQNLVAKQHNALIMTFGEARWQTEKLKALMLPSIIRTLVVQKPKVEYFAHYYEPDMIMVDDRATELEAVAAQYPDVKLYWMTRPEGKYLEPVPQCSHTQIESLNQIKL